VPHANRSKVNRSEISNPTPAEIRAARDRAGLTMKEAAELIYSTLRTWQDWEAEGDTNRRMHPGLFELFQIKTGQSRKYGPK
jgi:DNA-binding transcriptional regulator YiaG